MGIDKKATLARLDFAGFWESELSARIVSRNGKNWLCRSPFREDRNPSLSVNVDTGLFNDFGDETHKGDVFDFVMQRDAVDFPTALRYVGQYAGMTAPSTVRPAPAARPAPKPEPRTCPRADCRSIERGCCLQKRRTWSIAEIDSYDKVDAYGRELADFHASAFLHTEELKQWKAAHGGSVGGFRGPCAAPGIWIDIDRGDDLPQAQLDLLALLERLETRGVALDNVRIWYSGKKGFHLLVRNRSLEQAPASESTPEQCRRLATHLAGPIPIDKGIYKTLSLIRVANSIHPGSGLHKIPLYGGEVALPIMEIQSLAKRQRSMKEVKAAAMAAFTERNPQYAEVGA